MNPLSGREQPAWRMRIARALDTLYPAQCALCEVELSHGRALCDACGDDLPRLCEPFCESCGEAFPGKIVGPFECPNCAGMKFAFEFARPAMVCETRTLDLIHRLKYQRQIHLADVLAALAAEAFGDPRLERALAERWPLVPVPLHHSRLRQRHFNQAGEIARVLSDRLGLPVLHALRRLRRTDTQTLLGRKRRMENLRGAFGVTRHTARWLDGGTRGAVLVDDVLTTGSTVNECAKTLLKSGFSRVQVVTVMRG
jgi:competence protein ComFC